MVRFLDMTVGAETGIFEYLMKRPVQLIFSLVILVLAAVFIVSVFIVKKDRSEKLLDKIMEEDEKTQ
jgi:ABC-type sulfate transport system permease subunit